MITKTLVKHFIQKADQPYYINGTSSVSLTYKELFQKAWEYSLQLKEQNKQSGVVAILATSPDSIMPMIIACWLADFIPAVFDPETKLQNYNRTHSVINDDFIFSDRKPDTEFHALPYVLASSVDCSPISEEQIHCLEELDEHKPALILFSSGTTDIPKCIPLSLSNIENNLNAFNHYLRINENDCFLSSSPYFYAHGLYNSFLVALCLGSKVVYCGTLNLFNAENTLKNALKHQASIYHITPSMLPILTMVGKRFQADLPVFKYVISGTAKLTFNEKAAFEEVYDIPVIQQYGMTEALFIAVNKNTSELPDSVGKPIVDELLIQDGEIKIRSKSIYGNYFNQAEETAKSFKDTWFYTGDLGLLDENNNLTITGRTKNLIKKGGITINPEEINQFLLSQHAIQDAATIGIADNDYGEEVISVVRLTKPITEKELLEKCKTVLNPKSIPKRILSVDSIPKTASGKVDHQALTRFIVEKKITKQLL